MKKLRIAIPTVSGSLCQHFGHCEQFALLDVDAENKTILKTTMVTPPPHEPGLLPTWLHEQGAHVIIASGMGESRPEWLDDWRRWTSLTAVSRDNLFFVQPDLIQRHTPRLLDGAERLCQHLETARSRRPR